MYSTLRCSGRVPYKAYGATQCTKVASSQAQHQRTVPTDEGQQGIKEAQCQMPSAPIPLQSSLLPNPLSFRRLKKELQIVLAMRGFSYALYIQPTSFVAIAEAKYNAALETIYRRRRNINSSISSSVSAGCFSLHRIPVPKTIDVPSKYRPPPATVSRHKRLANKKLLPQNGQDLRNKQ